MAKGANFNMYIRARTSGTTEIKRLGNSMQGVQGKMKNLNNTVKGLTFSFKRFIGVVTGSAILVKIFGDTAKLETQTKSIEVLTGSLEEATKIIKELQAFGNVTPFESKDLIDTAKLLKAYNIETSKVVETVKRLSDIAGATGSRVNEIALAYGQIMSLGRLQSQDFKQLQQRGVALGQELQKMYNMTGAEFTKAMSDGRISAEAVEVAIKRLTTAGGKYADGAISQSETLNGMLSTLLDNITVLAQNVGRILKPLFKWIFESTNIALKGINRMLAEGIKGSLYRQIGAANAAITFQGAGGASRGTQQIEDLLPSLKVLEGANRAQLDLNVDLLNKARATLQRITARNTNEKLLPLQAQITKLLEENIAAIKALPTVELANLEIPTLLSKLKDLNQNLDTTFGSQMQSKLKAFNESLKSIGENMAASMINSIKKLEDTLVDFVMTGKFEFRELANSIIKDMTRVLIRQTVTKPFTSFLSSMFEKNALGNVYNQQGLVPFARGGVVDKPTVFPFSQGVGLMGEAGAEAILPLTRRNGKLGVEGGGSTAVTVNVDASGSSAEGSSGKGRELGRMLGAAIQAELIKQRRAGGILAT